MQLSQLLLTLFGVTAVAAAGNMTGTATGTMTMPTVPTVSLRFTSPPPTDCDLSGLLHHTPQTTQLTRDH